MYEGGCDEHAGTEMARQEKDVMRDWEAWKTTGDDGKGACYSLLLT